MASRLNFFLQFLSRKRLGSEGQRRERCLLLLCFPFTAASAVLCLLWEQELEGEARSLAVPAVGQWENKTIWELQASLFKGKTGEKLQEL